MNNEKTKRVSFLVKFSSCFVFIVVVFYFYKKTITQNSTFNLVPGCSTVPEIY